MGFHPQATPTTAACWSTDLIQDITDIRRAARRAGAFKEQLEQRGQAHH